MGAIGKSLHSVVGNVIKDVGKSGELPKEVLQLQKTMEQTQKHIDPLLGGLDAVKDLLDDVMRSGDVISGSLDKATQAVSKSDFGLDPKKSDDKKKIDEGRKALMAAFQDAKTSIDKTMTSFSKLNATVASLGKSGGLN